jgi:hypothetical protein
MNFGDYWRNKNSPSGPLLRIKYLDNLTNDYANKNNIFLIRIPYKKLKVIDKILSLLLKKYNKNGNNPIK